MKYELGKQLADKFIDLLRPACLRIGTVGSVRRADEKSLSSGVHDIEFLMILKSGHPVPEFGRHAIYKTHLEKTLADLECQGLIRQAADKKDGDKYKKRAICNVSDLGMLNEFTMDLFIVTPETWGLQKLIRTGSSWFSHRAVTNKSAIAWNRETGAKASGFLPNELKYRTAKDSPDGLSAILRGAERLSVHEEEDVFDVIFGRQIPPSERRKYAELMK